MNNRVVSSLVMTLALLVLLLGALPVGASADPGQPVGPASPPRMPPVPGADSAPKPFDPSLARPHPALVQMEADLVHRPGAALPVRKRHQLPPAAGARIGAVINTGQGIAAAYGEHYVPLTTELPGSPSGQSLFTTLKSSSGCLEAVTAHYRNPGDVTRHGHGFYDFCAGAWKIFIELTTDAQAKYLSLGWLATEIYQAGATWWGIVYNWQVGAWETWTSAGASSDVGWSAFEQVNLEQSGCPTFPSVYANHVQVWQGTAWTNLAPPYGGAIGIPGDAACVRSYYRLSWFQSLWNWGAFYQAPDYLLPFPGGLTRRITCIGTGCTNHDVQYNQYSWDFGMAFGEDVVAARGGTVLRVVQDQRDIDPNLCSIAFINNVNYILVDHGGGVTTQYAHLKQNSAYVTPGQIVRAGAKLGQVGSSGYVCGYHLHFKKQVTPASPSEDLITASLAVQFDDASGATQGSSVASDNWAQP